MASVVVLRQLKLIHFKGFESFTVSLRPRVSVLVGPNNAGKSTIISALRLCASLIGIASRRKLTEPVFDETRSRRVRGGFLARASKEFVDENVRYEFRQLEARLELIFSNGSVLYVVWPVDGDPFFYLEHIPGMQPKSAAQVREMYPSIGIVSSLTPVEHQEIVLSPQHVRDNFSTKLTSRHFRNQLQLTRDEDEDEFRLLIEYLEQNTPEVRDLDLVRGSGSDGERQLDLFFRESSGSTERELFWAGDGMQIWLQVLFHLWRLKDRDCVLLDEPDVFLHPDLQRRLVRVIEDGSNQVMLATHAPEVLAEADRDEVIIIDRLKRQSRRVSNEQVLGQLNDVLGSGFNLRLAKALRAKVALFVEGQDMKILKNIARAIGADHFAKEIGLSVIPMQGASNRKIANSFGWLNQNLLDSAVIVRLVLDRDYMPDEQCKEIKDEFSSQSVNAHLWAKKELESYLIVESVIARVSGAPESVVFDMVDKSLEATKNTVFSRLHAGYRRRALELDHAKSEETITEVFHSEFEDNWTSRDWRLSTCPPKIVLSELNSLLQSSGYKAVSSRSLSARIRAGEIVPEMTSLVSDIEQELRSN